MLTTALCREVRNIRCCMSFSILMGAKLDAPICRFAALNQPFKWFFTSWFKHSLKNDSRQLKQWQPSGKFFDLLLSYYSNPLLIWFFLILYVACCYLNNYFLVKYGNHELRLSSIATFKSNIDQCFYWLLCDHCLSYLQHYLSRKHWL